ncbi:uracil-xanthine permease family protein [Terrisporobacter sp.]|uniref:uracil-xanthine permease family protein n=1 Tax=Terrisporobacter sp. TaxID=1965305 RepID=UPI00260BAF7B|nr:uracil-xanthine permease family protein [Terrisporobacter sp.]
MRKVILSIQHLLAMFGATVLVPLLTGFDPSVAIFCAGVGTLIFHKCTDWKVPVFLGSSFAFISVINQVSETFNGDLSYAQGGIIVAGIIYVVMSFIVKVVGPEKVKKYFPPQVTGAMIIVIGLNLLPTAVNMAMNHIGVAILTLGVAAGINKFVRGSARQFAVIIAIFVGIIASMIVGISDFSSVSNASYFSIPNFTAPKFSLEAVIIIAPVVLAVFMEHVGDITTNGAVVGKNFLENPGLHKTLLGDGLATLFAGLMGGPANTTYGENTALLAITKNYDPKLLRLTAVFAIVISCVGKFGGLLQSIPQPVMGGISIYLFSMITFIGIKTIKDSKCYKESANVSVIAVILAVGLTTCYIKHFTGIEIGVPIASNAKLTGLSLAALVGIIINRVINHKDFKKEKDESIGELIGN